MLAQPQVLLMVVQGPLWQVRGRQLLQQKWIRVGMRARGQRGHHPSKAAQLAGSQRSRSKAWERWVAVQLREFPFSELCCCCRVAEESVTLGVMGALVPRPSFFFSRSFLRIVCPNCRVLEVRVFRALVFSHTFLWRVWAAIYLVLLTLLGIVFVVFTVFCAFCAPTGEFSKPESPEPLCFPTLFRGERGLPLVLSC